MAATAEDWFSSTVKPDASVREYTTAPPRGMTNAPQNPKVRAQLLKDLNAFSVQLEAPVWPPPANKGGPPGPGSMELRWQLGLPRCPSSPAVFGGTSCPSRHPAPLPKVKREPEKSPKRGKRGDSSSSRARGTSSSPSKQPGRASGKASASSAPSKEGAVEKKPKWFYSAGLDKHAGEFEIYIERTGSMKLGISEYGGALIATPELGTLVDEWNRENEEKPELQVREGDRIVAVNEIREPLRKMVKNLKHGEAWDIKVSKAWDNGADAMAQSHGSPTARWRTKREFMLEDEDHGPKGEPKKSGAAFGSTGGGMGETAKSSDKAGSKGRDSSKGTTEAWHHPAQQKILDRVPSDRELRNARDALKGQSGLHNAAVSDRFRFCADMSMGAPLCIKGSGTACGTPSDVWASDASFLVKFHNGAIRNVNPSTLQPKPEEVVPKKKKKKKDDENDLDMGVFQPKYPIDESLKSLRKLKKQMFPDEVRREEELAKQRSMAFLFEQQAKDQERVAFMTNGFSR